MFGAGSGEPGTRSSEQLRPLVRIELATGGFEFGLELDPATGFVFGAIDEEMVRPLRGVAGDFLMMAVLARSRRVHGFRVPLAKGGGLKGGNRISAPMKIKAKLAVPEPVWCRPSWIVPVDGFPGGCIWGNAPLREDA